MLKDFWNNIPPRKKGIIFLLMSSFSFAVMSLFISLSGDMPIFEKALFRNLVALMLSIFILARSEEKFKIKKGSLPFLFLRAGFGTVSLVANFYANTHINISDAMILNKLSPFFAIIASIFVLGEIANLHQWGAVIAALIGALFVVKPAFLFHSANVGPEFTFPAIIGLLGGIGAGIAYTFMRKLSLKGERSMLIVGFFSLFSCVACIPPIIMDHAAISPKQLFYCIMCGVAACCGQVCITSAYKACPAKEISVYDYSTVIFAAILGMLFLNEFPDKWSILGYVIIIGASVYSFLYNNGYLTKKKVA